MKRFLSLSQFLFCTFILLCSSPSYGQQSDPIALDIVSQAIAAIQGGNADAAIDPLEDLFEIEPAWYSADHFSLAYWLGQAYFVDGHIEDAREVWTLGAQSLEAAERFDPRLETALLAATFDNEWTEDYAASTTRYLRILEQLRCIYQPHAITRLYTVPASISIHPPRSYQKRPWIIQSK